MPNTGGAVHSCMEEAACEQHACLMDVTSDQHRDLSTSVTAACSTAKPRDDISKSVFVPLNMAIGHSSPKNIAAAGTLADAFSNSTILLSPYSCRHVFVALIAHCPSV